MVSVFSVYLFFPIGRLLAIPFGWFTSEIREQNAKLLERIAALEADKFQQLQVNLSRPICLNLSINIIIHHA
jgi:hypothetical protein